MFEKCFNVGEKELLKEFSNDDSKNKKKLGNSQAAKPREELAPALSKKRALKARKCKQLRGNSKLLNAVIHFSQLLIHLDLEEILIGLVTTSVCPGRTSARLM